MARGMGHPFVASWIWMGHLLPVPVLRLLGLWSYIGEVRSTAEGDSGWIHSPELIRLFTLATCARTNPYGSRHPPLRIRSFRIESTEPAALGMFVFTHNTQRCRRAYSGFFSALSGPSSPCDSAVRGIFSALEVTWQTTASNGSRAVVSSARAARIWCRRSCAHCVRFATSSATFNNA